VHAVYPCHIRGALEPTAEGCHKLVEGLAHRLDGLGSQDDFSGSDDLTQATRNERAVVNRLDKVHSRWG